MRAEAVIYVGDLERMQTFYATCFALVEVDRDEDFVGLGSDDWLVTLVASREAGPASDPPVSRASTPIKLALHVVDITTVRHRAAELGGSVSPPAEEWQFRGSTRCDGVDPEGNVFQLIERSA